MNSHVFIVKKEKNMCVKQIFCIGALYRRSFFYDFIYDFVTTLRLNEHRVRRLHQLTETSELAN